MPSSQSQSDALGDLPGFRPMEETELPPLEESDEVDEGPSLPESMDLSTTSPPSTTHPPAASPGERTRSTSSQGSTDDDERPPPPRPAVSLSGELEEELVYLTGGAFETVGAVLNRLERRRTRSATRMWLVSQEEAERFGTAAGRIAGRHIPDELKQGDGADLVIMGSVALGYVQGNLAGRDDLERSGQLPAPVQPPPPVAPASPRPVQPPAGTPVASVVPAPIEGAEAATPPPPSVISPGI